MPGSFMTKMQAVAYVMTTLGVGRSVVMRALDILAAQGSISLEPSPFDARAQRISQQDVAKVVEFIRSNT